MVKSCESTGESSRTMTNRSLLNCPRSGFATITRLPSHPRQGSRRRGASWTTIRALPHGPHPRSSPLASGLLPKSTKFVRCRSHTGIRRPVRQSVRSVTANRSRRSFMAFLITRRHFKQSWIQGGSALEVRGLGMSRRNGAVCPVSMSGGLLDTHWLCTRLNTGRVNRNEISADMAEPTGCSEPRDCV